MSIASLHSLLMATFLLILYLIIIFVGSGIKWKSSTKLTLGMAAKEGKNNNNNHGLVKNIQCWKGYAFISNSWNNSLNITGHSSNIAAIGSHSKTIATDDDSKNININDGSGSDIATDNDSIISDSLRGRAPQRQEVDIVRDPMVKLSSDGDWELTTTGVSEAEDTTELVSGNQNVNINKSSSDIAADDSNMTTTEQPPPPIEKEQDLPTTVESAESEPANKELVIGT